jgi:hypothetical protein
MAAVNIGFNKNHKQAQATYLIDETQKQSVLSNFNDIITTSKSISLKKVLALFVQFSYNLGCL